MVLIKSVCAHKLGIENGFHPFEFPTPHQIQSRVEIFCVKYTYCSKKFSIHFSLAKEHLIGIMKCKPLN